MSPASLRTTAWLALALVLLGADQATKLWAQGALELHRPMAIGPFLNFTLTYNTGAAFSFLSDAGGWQRWFFVAVSSLVSVVLVVWLWRVRHQAGGLLPLSLSLVLSGALGNLWDRATLGYVVDFVDVYVGHSHWPAFNVADSAICIGAGILVWLSVRGTAPAAANDTEDRPLNSSKEL